MPLEGQELLPREICRLIASHWPNSKIKAVATILAESAGFVGAYHLNDNGTKDVGLMQIDIMPDAFGTTREKELLTDPVVNVDAGYALYEQPWERDKKTGIRQWQPWAAYTSGIATFPKAWVWHQNATGFPVGPWVHTGRYLHRAIAGVANWHHIIHRDLSLAEAQRWMEKQAEIWKLDITGTYVTKGVLAWHFPLAPPLPPSDGIGPRPIPNDGI